MRIILMKMKMEFKFNVDRDIIVLKRFIRWCYTTYRFQPELYIDQSDNKSNSATIRYFARNILGVCWNMSRMFDTGNDDLHMLELGRK